MYLYKRQTHGSSKAVFNDMCSHGTCVIRDHTEYNFPDAVGSSLRLGTWALGYGCFPCYPHKEVHKLRHKADVKSRCMTCMSCRENADALI